MYTLRCVQVEGGEYFITLLDENQFSIFHEHLDYSEAAYQTVSDIVDEYGESNIIVSEETRTYLPAETIDELLEYLQD